MLRRLGEDAQAVPISLRFYLGMATGVLAAGLALAGRSAWLPVPSALWLAGVGWLLIWVCTLMDHATLPEGKGAAYILSPLAWSAAFAGGLLLIAAWYVGRREGGYGVRTKVTTLYR